MKVWVALWRMKRIIDGWGDGGVSGGEGRESNLGDGDGGRWGLVVVEAVLARSRGFGS